MKSLSYTAAAIACLGLALPQSLLAQTAQRPVHVKPPIHDLILDQGGKLRGQVVRSQNAPVANTKVIVISGRKKVAETTTDADGRFEFAGLRAGMYAVGSAAGFGVYRTWTAEVAPPSALSAALIVEDERVVRGQGQLWYWMTNPFIVSALIAALIAIPIAVNNNDKKSGS